MDQDVEQRLREITEMSMGYFSSPMFPYRQIFGEYNSLVDELLENGMREPLPPEMRLDPYWFDAFVSPRYKGFEAAWHAAHPDTTDNPAGPPP